MIVSRRFKRAPFTHSVVALAVLIAFAQPVSAASLSASLSADEQQLASAQAISQPWPQNRSAVQNNTHSLGVQTLSVELDERKKNNNQRRARVYQFNYSTQQSRLILIDLITRETIKAQIINTVHLPLNDQEIATARSLIEQQPDIIDALNVERRSRGLTELTDLSSLDVKASIFEPNDKTSLCTIQRCALLSLFDSTRTVFAVEPIVNLQQLGVSKLQQSL